MQRPDTQTHPDVAMNVETTEISVGATLDRWLTHGWNEGVQLDELRGLQTLRIRTRNSTYDVAVLEDTPGDVLVRGGRYFPDWTRVHLAGATLGGGFLKRFGVHVGLRMEFYWNGRRVITSTVYAIGRISAARTSLPC